MCCRFHIQEAGIDYLRSMGVETVISGDIHPGDTSLAIVAGASCLVVDRLRWGMTVKSNSLVINARSETLWEKPLFRENSAKRRCVLPADCFYEWDRQKIKNTFWPSAGGVLFLAGIYDQAGNFVIITTKADRVMQPVHDRMPVCLQEERLHDWLFDESGARNILATNNGIRLYREKLIEQHFVWE